MAESAGEGRLINPFEGKVRVTFEDGAGTEFRIEMPRGGHTDREVRAAAYFGACGQVVAGKFRPFQELRFVSITKAD